MLSILIPTYNYNVYPLVEVIEQQILKANIVFELICVDDGSFSLLNENNQKINALANCKFIEAKKNSGRTATRQFLAEQAQYNWLLFLDCDVIPVEDNFIENYINEINSHTEAVFGGFAYSEGHTNIHKTLRYTFGKHREEVDALKRNRNPYKVIISANFIIKKDLFLKLNKNEHQNIYGLDYLFSAMLKQYHIKVKHINNEVYHLGIDDNPVYLEKAKKAVETLSFLYKNNKIKTNAISLLKAYLIIKNIGLSKLFGKLMFKYNSNIEENLTGKSPSLFLFDLYRLGYFCRLI